MEEVKEAIDEKKKEFFEKLGEQLKLLQQTIYLFRYSRAQLLELRRNVVKPFLYLTEIAAITILIFGVLNYFIPPQQSYKMTNKALVDAHLETVHKDGTPHTEVENALRIADAKDASSSVETIVGFMTIFVQPFLVCIFVTCAFLFIKRRETFWSLFQGNCYYVGAYFFIPQVISGIQRMYFAEAFTSSWSKVSWGLILLGLSVCFSYRFFNHSRFSKSLLLDSSVSCVALFGSTWLADKIFVLLKTLIVIINFKGIY